MAPRRKDSYLMYLNADRLEMELRKRLRKANSEVKNLLRETMLRNVSALPMKSNSVRMAGGSTTSDIERKNALINSITGDRVYTYEKTWDTMVMGSYVDAMASNFKDSHVGWYYEVGTGEESDPDLYSEYGLSASLGDVNPYRLPEVGAPIVSRSRRDGGWKDFGGNLRSTSSNIGGIGGNEPPEGIEPDRYEKIKAQFRRSIGEDIEAYEWYRNAVEEVREEILSIYTNSIRDLNILDPKYGIFYLNPKYEIGKR